MAKAKRNLGKWKELDLLEVKTMATNPFTPGEKTAQRILNVHAHERDGGLVLRPGYTIKYQKPTHSTITNSSYLNFDMFYDRVANINGQEITCLIQKGTLVALDNGGTPIVTDTMNGFWFWCRPDWTGNVWDDQWKWVNKTFITKITTASDATYTNMIKIFGNEVSHNILDGGLVGWTIYNKTQDETAKILTNIDEGSNVIRINHTLYNSSWAVDDVLIISKHFLNADYQTTLYNTVEVEDIVFHNVNNDLRIGFGGEELRPGLAIGYRQNYLQLVKFDFPNMHPDLTSAALQDFCEKNDLIMDTHILEKDSYGIELVASGDGSLAENIYYFRLTGRQDLYTEQLLAEDYISVETNSTISIRPFAYLGKENPRLTSFKLYYSTDNITFYKIQEFKVKDTAYHSTTWKVDQFSRLITLGNLTELHDESNAASIANESNTVGSWTVINSLGAVSSDTIGAGGSSYSLLFEDYTPGVFSSVDREGIKFPVTGIKKGEYYDITLQLKAKIPYKKIYIWFAGNSLSPIGRTQEFVEALESDLSEHTISLLADNIAEDISYLCITVSPEHGNDLFVFGSNEVVRSHDNGISFSTLSTGIADNDPIILGDRMLTFVTTNIWASFDHGSTWDIFGSAFPNGITSLKLFDEKIYVGDSSGGVFISTDRGATFTTLSADVSGGSTYPIRSIAENSSYLYVATYGGGIYRSSDAGTTWNAANTGIVAHTDFLEIYADDSGLTSVALYTGNLYLWKSVDDGDNWTAGNSGVNIGGTGTGDLVHDGTYLWIPTTHLTGANGGIYRTNDYGATVSDVAASGGLTEDSYKYITYRNGTIFCGTASSSKLFFTSDSGASWNEMLAGAAPDFGKVVWDENTFWADLISLKQKDLSLFSNVSVATTEMKTEMGYTPVYDLVRGWDQTINLKGRIYYLNPYIEKRYENFLLVSHIHSDGSYMWDISTFSNFRELERFDSGTAVGMAVLSTTEIMILKDKSNEILSDDGLVGVLREPILGISCVARNSIVDLSGLIMWAGVEDIYTFSTTKGVRPILEDTIRDIYLALDNKSSFFAIRDRYNTYRLRVADPTNKTEFLFSKILDVIEEKKHLYPEIYREDSEQTLNFLSAGNIYGILHNIDNIGYGKLYAGNYGERL